TVAAFNGSTTTTDSAGDYTETLSNGTYAVTASASGFAAQTRSVAISGSAVRQDFALAASSVPPPTYRLQGTVESRSDASPIGGASIGVLGGPSMTTGGNGTFSFDVPNGSYTLVTGAPGWARAMQSVTVAGGAVNVVVLLTRFAWTLDGVVSDAGTGQAIIGARVSATGATLSAPISSVSNVSGGYLLRLPNGTYTLDLVAVGYANRTVTQVISGASIGANLDLSALSSVARFELSGSVRFPGNGSPAPGIEIEVAPATASVTDASGEFSVLLPNGSYEVSVHAGGWRASARSVAIAGGPATLALTLEPFTYEITGVVRFVSGVPAARVDVTTEPLMASASTSGDGSFALALPNGTFVLLVTGSGIRSTSLPLVVSGAPEVLDVNVTAASSGGSSSGGAPWGSPDLAGSPMLLWAFLGVVGSGAGLGILAGVRWVQGREP
ncbi:MAG TPA: carboxypeptidase regulatory-like domain-containing protein, partial [Thermoplasmata archaeon]|nr:carboxypeptidase regulatory-like domain-containing protein [Thermoplasmata archaeon]